MKLTKIVKWDESLTGNCPAIYRADTGDLVIQGWRLDAEARGQLDDVLADEDAVRIPASLLDSFLRAGD